MTDEEALQILRTVINKTSGPTGEVFQQAYHALAVLEASMTSKKEGKK